MVLEGQKNLKDQLCSSALPPEKPLAATQGIVIDNNQCNRPGSCNHCRRFNRTGIIKSHSTGRIYRIVHRVTYQTNNLIYALTCDICGQQYVSQTQNRIMDRFNSHLSTIRRKSDTTVARHMASHNISTDDPPITISILQLINADPPTDYAKQLRDRWENMWMARLNTYIPHGLNVQD